MDNTGVRDTLYQLDTNIRAAVQRSGGKNALPPEITAVLLARFFDYQVTQGGFAQLLYNARGAYLQEMEEMLVTAAAEVAHKHYVQAIQLCLQQQETYAAFLANDYREENTLKNDLHGISLAYFRTGRSFAEEYGRYIQRATAITEAWLQQQ
jgi:hypothetical protein